jgi:hypothetical protein
MAMLEFNQQVNASIVDPGFITKVRKKLALHQREAGEIFGGGVNAFSPIRERPDQAAPRVGEAAQDPRPPSRSAG